MTFLNRTIISVAMLLAGAQAASADQLHQCTMGGKTASYHADEVPRMKSLGAECRALNAAEKIVCSVGSVQSVFAASEAAQVLETSPRANCQVGGRLYISNTTAQSIGATVNVNTETQSVAISQFSTTPSLGFVDTAVVLFKLGKHNLLESEKKIVKSFARRRAGGNYVITITGYADASGSNKRNQLLSLQRAGVVKEALLDAGVLSRQIISVDALGEESLRNKTRNGQRAQVNRAVEIRAYR